jgi:hypothetical protein
MLKEKTKGNLHPQEAQLFEGLLGDLRMQYVQLVRADRRTLKTAGRAKIFGERYFRKKIILATVEVRSSPR